MGSILTVALTKIKDSIKTLAEAFSKMGVSANEAAEAMAQVSPFMNIANMPQLEDGENYTVTSTTWTSDGTGDPPQVVTGDGYDWGTNTVWIGPGTGDSVTVEPYRSATVVVPWTSTTVDLGREDGNMGLLDMILASGGSPMEVERLGAISRTTGVGVRELLSLFTEIGDRCKVRRDIPEEEYDDLLNAIAVNGLVNITKVRHGILRVNGKYIGLVALPDNKIGDTFELQVKTEDNTIPLVRKIRLPGMKPKVATVTFKRDCTIEVDNCNILFPVFDTDDNVYRSENGDYCKED
jgi:hypothetical protein